MQQTNNQQKPDNFMVWAILSTLFCSLLTGIIAIIHANEVDSQWYKNNHEEAVKEMMLARKWTFISLGIGVLTYIAFPVLGLGTYGFIQSVILALIIAKTIWNGFATANPLIAVFFRRRVYNSIHHMGCSFSLGFLDYVLMIRT